MGKSRRRDYDAWEEQEHLQQVREIRNNRKRKNERFDDHVVTDEQAWRGGTTVRRRRNQFEDT